MFKTFNNYHYSIVNIEYLINYSYDHKIALSNLNNFHSPPSNEQTIYLIIMETMKTLMKTARTHTRTFISA